MQNVQNTSVRLFQSDFLERFTHMHPLLPLALFGPVVLLAGVLGFSAHVLGENLFYFGLGMLFWSFTEYCIHRLVFHYRPKTPWGKRIMFLFHEVHHRYPNDQTRLLLSPLMSVPLAVVFYYFFKEWGDYHFVKVIT
ncbi:MAG: hypothetical protein HYU97_00910 [Deltaproteobacteria bacterium]|nr:hypothetical protein [Deltaproteobacteria bacterium]